MTNKKWPHLKTHFSTKYKSYKTQLKINAQQGGFHSSHASAHAVTTTHEVDSLPEALDHLANTAVLDKKTLDNLTNEIN